jgi:exopolysaccharide biosynthesis polyprenyl glycosylphosphotransferase
MSTVELRPDQRTWPAMANDQWTAAQWPSHSRAERLLPALSGICLFLADQALVVGAFLLAYWVRFVAWDDSAAALSLDRYVRIAVIVGLASSAMFALRGLYDEEHPAAWPTRLYTIISAVSTALVLAVTASFFLGDQAFSRIWFATGWAMAVIALVAWRWLAIRLYVAVRGAVAPATRVAIVGANPLGQQLAGELAEWYTVVGYVDNGSDLVERGAQVPLLGPIAQLEAIVHNYSVDELVIALPAARREQVSRLIDRGFHRRVKVKLLPDIGELLPERLEVQHLGGRPYIGFKPVATVSWLKRVLDLLLVGVGLIVIAPLLAAVALAIKLDSRGPIFYKQLRVGKDGRHFWMLKFRSMCVDADRRLEALRTSNEASGPLFKMRRDPRITRVGGFLRRFSLDELPQLFNVLAGDMSLVGPRPPIPSEVAQYEDWQLGRLRAVPGLTGLWQVSGRSEVSFHDMVRLDLHYIRNWSLSLDFEILLRTIPAVISSRGAY